LTRPSPPHSGHFSRMGPEAGRKDQLDDLTVRQLARRMAHGGGSRREDSDIPAGYTYVGQFVAHDLTFDVLALGATRRHTDGRLRRGRSPGLDLDSLYGRGPSAGERGERERRELLEDDGVTFRLGTAEAKGRYPALPGFDLPRGGGRMQRPALARRAVIADERNDDNLAVAQMHVAFLRFHNRVARDLQDATGDRFTAARRMTTLHYQWMVWHDFLPKICDATVLEAVRTGGRKVFEPHAEPGTPPTMPREFAGAAFRIGHSMIRDAYDWSTRPVPLEGLFRYSGRAGDLHGGAAVPSFMVADFRRMFDLRPLREELERPLNVAKRLDTRLVSGLAELPSGIFETEDTPAPGDLAGNLAFRNLMRARETRLATGQQMVRRLRRRGVAVTPLGRAEILVGAGGVNLSGLTPGQKNALVTRTPLWFYVLREAEVHGGRLHGVGARIVAEAFHRVIEGARTWSFLRERTWRPTLGRAPGDFDMLDLLDLGYGDRLDLAELQRRPRRPPRR
jgi:hypothetical protein